MLREDRKWYRVNKELKYDGREQETHTRKEEDRRSREERYNQARQRPFETEDQRKRRKYKKVQD